MPTVLKDISVVGLHGRFDLNHEFERGVNIIYGKNGEGKSTVLHILANLLNGDYHRFAYLDFTEIIVNFDDCFIKIKKNSQEGRNSSLTIIDSRSINETHIQCVEIFDIEEKTDRMLDRGDAEEALIHQKRAGSSEVILQAAYFPAFRALMEAWSSKVQNAERRYSMRPDSINRNDQTKSLYNTWLARQLFGRFIPQLNYPSPLEIQAGLSNQVKNILIFLAQRDRDLLADAFLRIFGALQTETKTTEPAEKILGEIIHLIDQMENSVNYYGMPIGAQNSAVYGRLRMIARDFSVIKSSDERFASVLDIYRSLLNERIGEQERRFSSVRQYLNSVNQFLEGKKIDIVQSDNKLAAPRVVIQFEGDVPDAGMQILSSGERQIVTLIYAATRMSKQGIVLIDEPEISLHVDWQRMLLRRMAEQLGERQIIVCTHSPTIGADYLVEMKELEMKKTAQPRVSVEESLVEEVED